MRKLIDRFNEGAAFMVGMVAVAVLLAAAVALGWLLSEVIVYPFTR